MTRPIRFHICLNLMALAGALTLIVSEYFYDAFAAVLGIILAGVMLATSALGFWHKVAQKTPAIMRWFLHGVTGVFVLAIVIVLLFGGSQGPLSRAFTVGHFTMIIMAAKFALARRTRDYAQVFALTLLLMIVGVITCTGVILAPLVLLYMVLAGFTLILYQLQRQAELVSASHFVGMKMTEENQTRARELVKGFWKQLGHSRFGLSCLWIMIFALLLAGVVFFAFPRLEAGTLLGNRFSSRQSGFSDELDLGQVNNNQELRQVIARVSMRDNGRAVQPEQGPFYLRTVTLDCYQQNQVNQSSAGWFRSGYFTKDLLPEISPTAGALLEQEILLTEYASEYLPGLYPLNRVVLEGSQNKLQPQDRSAVRKHPEGAGSVHYKAYTLKPVSGERGYKWFRRQVKNLGGFWYYYARDPFWSSQALREKVQEIASKELLDQRTPLQMEQNQIYAAWMDTFPKDAEGFIMPTAADEGYTGSIDDPNDFRPVEAPLIDALYQNGLQLDDIDREIMARILKYLRANHPYSATPPPLPEPKVVKDKNKDERVVYTDPIEDFLEHPGMAGNCEYFASAAALLGRSAGLRTRLAVGYLVDEYLPENQYYLVRQSNAHAWVELYTSGQDWVRFEATPPADSDGPKAAASGFMRELSARLENLQYRWLRFLADGKVKHRFGWAKDVSGWLGRLGEEDKFKEPGRLRLAFIQWFTLAPEESFISLFGRWLIFFAFLINLSIGLRELLAWGWPRLEVWREHRKILQVYQDEASDFYPRMLRLLEDIRLYKPAAQTPREFALEVIGYDKILEPVGDISEAYYQVRFGRHTVGDKHRELIEAELVKLEAVIKSIQKMAPRPWPWEKE